MPDGNGANAASSRVAAGAPGVCGRRRVRTDPTARIWKHTPVHMRGWFKTGIALDFQSDPEGVHLHPPQRMRGWPLSLDACTAGDMGSPIATSNEGHGTPAVQVHCSGVLASPRAPALRWRGFRKSPDLVCDILLSAVSGRQAGSDHSLCFCLHPAGTTNGRPNAICNQ